MAAERLDETEDNDSALAANPWPEPQPYARGDLGWAGVGLHGVGLVQHHHPARGLGRLPARVGRDVLPRTLFPLGDLTKPQVYELARFVGRDIISPLRV